MTTQPPFEIMVEGDLLRASLHGYWDLATMHQYIAALLKASRTVARPSYWLMNFSDFSVQAAAIAEQLAAGVSSAKSANAPIVAIVGNSALGAFQGKRVAREGGQASFTTVAAAEAWLRALSGQRGNGGEATVAGVDEPQVESEASRSALSQQVHRPDSAG